MSEPTQDCSEKHESEKSLSEFLVVDGDAAVDYDLV